MAKCKITYGSTQLAETEETAPVSITYNGSSIGTVAEGATKTLSCSGKYMRTNVIIGSKTLLCANKIMNSNVSVAVEQSITLVGTWLFKQTITAPSFSVFSVSGLKYNYTNASGTLVTANTGFTKAGTSPMYLKYAKVKTAVNAYNLTDNTWVHDNFRTIEITSDPTWSGTYANAFKEWLLENAYCLSAPLCFTAEQANSTVELTKIGSPSIANSAYSRDGVTWTTFTPSTTAGTNKITLANVGDTVYFRNDITGDFSASAYLKFVMSGKIGASGNVNSIYSSTGFSSLTTLTYQYCYLSLFYACHALQSAPLLPAKTLSFACYYQMFIACTQLKSAPEIMATTLAQYSCISMFYSCTSLETASIMSATTTASYSCYMMFSGCTSLTTITNLPATTLASACYASMFQGCTSLEVSDSTTSTATIAWVIPSSGTFANAGTHSDMFKNCAGTRSSDNLVTTVGGTKVYFVQNILPPIPYNPPIQDGSNLTLSGAYSATQSESDLEVQ